MPELMDFAGQWIVTRRIEQQGSPPARFSATATMTPHHDGLLYHEAGTLYLANSPPMHAERRYMWRQQADDIAVFFDDGRPFHTFSSRNPVAAHWCDPDDYRVRYDFSRWPEWHSVWRVQGPAKDYTMHTCYMRG